MILQNLLENTFLLVYCFKMQLTLENVQFINAENIQLNHLDFLKRNILNTLVSRLA